MNKYLFALLVLITAMALILVSGCQTVYVGAAVHAVNADAPEFNGNNPLGVVGGSRVLYQNGDNVVRGYCEHISSIPDYEAGYGLNMCGAKWEYDL